MYVDIMSTYVFIYVHKHNCSCALECMLIIIPDRH